MSDILGSGQNPINIVSNVKHISLLSTLLRETTLRNMGLGEKEFYKLLNGLDWMPASYENIANCLMENGVKKMYHAIINEDDIPTLFTIPNLKIFWCCRCHLVAKDGSTAHEHLHALVQYQKGTHLAFKKRMQRAKQRFHYKTTFKKIHCADHAVGVLRYICCKDGQMKNKRRDADGLVTRAHTHYCRRVYVPALLHSRNARKEGGCGYMRREIQEMIWEKLSDEWLAENVSGDGEYALHHEESCDCENGMIGKEKQAAANKKRKDYYETEEGKETKKKYAEKNRKKNDLIRELRMMKNCGSEAELTKETIARLIAMI